MPIGTLLLFACSLVLGITGQFLLKTGVLAQPPEASLMGIVTTFTSWRVILGLILYAISTVFWLFILKRLPLSLAYPTLSVNYIAIVAIGVFFLGEALTLNKAIGVTAIIIGVTALYL